MNLFTLINKEEVHLNSDSKLICASDFSLLLQASDLLKKTQEEVVAYKIQIASECEELKEHGQNEGFHAGLIKWNEQLMHLENEIRKVRKEMEQVLIPLAIAAVKKMIGKELETKPDTIANIVATTLKTVSQRRRVTIWVNQNDLEYVEEARPQLKNLFEHLETLTISARADVEPGGCIIETETGITNAQLDSQLHALEAAFLSFFQTQNGEI